jgi:hypothetical protein
MMSKCIGAQSRWDEADEKPREKEKDGPIASDGAVSNREWVAQAEAHYRMEVHSKAERAYRSVKRRIAAGKQIRNTGGLGENFRIDEAQE